MGPKMKSVAEIDFGSVLRVCADVSPALWHVALLVRRRPFANFPPSRAWRPKNYHLSPKCGLMTLALRIR